ncbi:MAG: UDP-N-acetylglucosamine 2-epimerase (non-hydrolyzing) [Actinomycetota bacterium]|nr:UDP-N-acetylglucosamine 2-epimerase (non-hydrolyzing) [Actinomycetota bacterium]
MICSVCFVVGARPNFMKAAPVYRALHELDPEIALLLVHTGQHYDAEMSSVFLDELELPRPDVFLGVGSGTHAEQTAKALVGVEQVLLEHRPSLCVVAGDVNSTLAAALAASKLQISVAHIEAGLRSFDEAMPEEANRRLTDHLSRILLAHSDGAVVNLLNEGIDSSRIHLVGNTMIDSVVRHLQPALAREPWSRFGTVPGGFALVTLHRPALVDDIELLRPTVEGLSALASRLPVIFPVHPRTKARLAAAGLHPEELRASGVTLSEPLGYLDFLALEAKAAFVLTDSGGVQEETSALGVRCFTLRDTTERPVTVELGTNTLLGVDPRRIRAIPELLEKETGTPGEIPLWDGKAGHRAAAVIDEFLSSTAANTGTARTSAGRSETNVPS